MQSSNNISYIKQGLKIPMVKSEDVFWRAENSMENPRWTSEQTI